MMGFLSIVVDSRATKAEESAESHLENTALESLCVLKYY